MQPEGVLLHSSIFDKSVLIYRRFEVDKGEQMPMNVTQLHGSIMTGMTIPFHFHFFLPGHAVGNLRSWFQYSLNNSQVITTPLIYKSAFEPQFIMRADAPMHFEDTPTRSYDHQVLVNELCRAGYSFQVLSHVFNVHPGIKMKLTASELLTVRKAKKLRRSFKKSFNSFLDAKYPETKDLCPRI
uniref:Uncharacterized protein n=1 Tax=Ditylenchus dipsaci TaxID=166011 RepID=A0A915DBN8_9BILA